MTVLSRAYLPLLCDKLNEARNFYAVRNGLVVACHRARVVHSTPEVRKDHIQCLGTHYPNNVWFTPDLPKNCLIPRFGDTKGKAIAVNEPADPKYAWPWPKRDPNPENS